MTNTYTIHWIDATMCDSKNRTEKNLIKEIKTRYLTPTNRDQLHIEIDGDDGEWIDFQAVYTFTSTPETLKSTVDTFLGDESRIIECYSVMLDGDIVLTEEE